MGVLSAIGGGGAEDSAWVRTDELRLRAETCGRIEIFERLDPHNWGERAWYLAGFYSESCTKVDERQFVIAIIGWGV